MIDGYIVFSQTGQQYGTVVEKDGAFMLGEVAIGGHFDPDKHFDSLAAAADEVERLWRLATEKDPETGLTAFERDVLDLEREFIYGAPGKVEAIRERFMGLSKDRYLRHLEALIDKPEAASYDPMVVKRLRRARTERKEAPDG
jgi:hypothetical protein